MAYVVCHRGATGRGLIGMHVYVHVLAAPRLKRPHQDRAGPGKRDSLAVSPFFLTLRWPGAMLDPFFQVQQQRFSWNNL